MPGEVAVGCLDPGWNFPTVDVAAVYRKSFALFGVFILAVAFEGVWRRQLAVRERMLALAAGLALIFSDRTCDVAAGAALFLIVAALQWIRPGPAAAR